MSKTVEKDKCVGVVTVPFRDMRFATNLGGLKVGL